MNQKIKTKEDLLKIKNEVNLRFSKMSDPNHSEQAVLIRIGMATCGIASGAKDVYDYFIEETEHQAIDACVTKTGCLGYCYAEPTVEVTLPGKKPVVFGYVDKRNAQEIIDNYINQNELPANVLPLNFKTIDE